MIKYRNLPCNCANNDPNGIRWVIAGEINYKDGSMESGILEWCTDLEDAIERYKDITRQIYGSDKDIDLCKYSSVNVETEIPFSGKNIEVGSTVVVFFHHSNEHGIYLVNKVVPRPGLQNNGTSKIADLLEVTTIKGYKTNSFDAGFVAAIIKHPTMGYRPYNDFVGRSYYKGHLAEGYYTYNLIAAIAFELSLLPFYIRPTEVKFDVYNLYKKSGSPGLNNTTKEIKVKHLRKWVRKNWSKLIVSKKDYEKQMTEYHTQEEEDYERDMMEDFMSSY